MAVHHAVGISCQRNSGYRPNRVIIMAQGLSTLDPEPYAPLYEERLYKEVYKERLRNNYTLHTPSGLA